MYYIKNLCSYIKQAENEPSLDDLAKHIGLSRGYVQKLFKSNIGISPKEYYQQIRNERLLQNLQNKNITQAIYASSFQSNSRFYETSRLGMTAKSYQARGLGQDIMLAVGQCSLGTILVGKTARGICTILLGDNEANVISQFEETYKNANLILGNSDFEQYVSIIIGFVDNKNKLGDIPLDIQGTVFQQKVWKALQDIPYGTTLTYSELADKIKSPKAVRAVASACAANLLAVAIPCHRVIAKNGALAGYRWGIERKEIILKREKKFNYF